VLASSGLPPVVQAADGQKQAQRGGQSVPPAAHRAREGQRGQEREHARPNTQVGEKHSQGKGCSRCQYLLFPAAHTGRRRKRPAWRRRMGSARPLIPLPGSWAGRRIGNALRYRWPSHQVTVSQSVTTKTNSHLRIETSEPNYLQGSDVALPSLRLTRRRLPFFDIQLARFLQVILHLLHIPSRLYSARISWMSEKEMTSPR
jgi:hypothetical protein